jgi:hypothetical protein
MRRRDCGRESNKVSRECAPHFGPKSANPIAKLDVIHARSSVEVIPRRSYSLEKQQISFNVSVDDYITIDPIRNIVDCISSVSMSADYEPISTQFQRLVNRTF